MATLTLTRGTQIITNFCGFWNWMMVLSPWRFCTLSHSQKRNEKRWNSTGYIVPLSGIESLKVKMSLTVSLWYIVAIQKLWSYQSNKNFFFTSLAEQTGLSCRLRNGSQHVEENTNLDLPAIQLCNSNRMCLLLTDFLTFHNSNTDLLRKCNRHPIWELPERQKNAS